MKEISLKTLASFVMSQTHWLATFAGHFFLFTSLIFLFWIKCTMVHYRNTFSQLHCSIQVILCLYMCVGMYVQIYFIYVEEIKIKNLFCVRWTKHEIFFLFYILWILWRGVESFVDKTENENIESMWKQLVLIGDISRIN